MATILYFRLTFNEIFFYPNRLHKREAMMLLKRFPNLDKEALQAKYPDIDVSKLTYNKKTLGSHEFNTA